MPFPNPNAEHPASKIAITISKILKQSFSTDIDSQIAYIELLNSEFMHNPVHLAIIQSLKEFRAIKRKTK